MIPVIINVIAEIAVIILSYMWFGQKGLFICILLLIAINSAWVSTLNAIERAKLL